MFTLKQARSRLVLKFLKKFAKPLSQLAALALSTLLATGANAALVTYSYTGSIYNFLNPAASNPYDGLHLTISFVHEELGASFNGSVKDTYETLNIYDGIRSANIVATAGDVVDVEDFWINSLHFITDASGNIERWWISLSTDGLNSLISSVYSGGTTAQDSIRLPGWSPACLTISGPCYAATDYGGTGEPAIPGWTMSAATAVPLPASIWIFISALGGLAGWRRMTK